MNKQKNTNRISSFLTTPGSCERAALIAELESYKMNGGGCAVEDMLKNEYETALRAAGFDLAHIYTTGDGRYKTSAPIQICKSTRMEVLEALYKYIYGDKTTATLADVFELAITEYQKLVLNGHREQNTLDHYTGAWNKYIMKSVLPDMPIARIKYKHLYEFYSDITANQAITRSTLRNVKTTVNYCFDYALQNDIIDSNVASDVRTDKLVCEKEKHHDAYTSKEIEKLREAIEPLNEVYARIIRLDLCLVARIGELEALRWNDIDFENRTVRIRAQMVAKRVNGKTVYKYVPHTKTGKYSGDDIGKRVLKLNSKAMEVLEEQRRKNPFGEYVFLSRNNTPLLTNRINEHLKKYCEQAGIRYLSSHSIRVRNITALFDNGVAPTKIQMAAGHADIRTTNGYCRSESCDEIDMDIWEKVL